MKRVLLIFLFLFISFSVFSQEERKFEDAVSLGLYGVSDGEGVFIQWERPAKMFDDNSFFILQATFISSTMELQTPGNKLKSVGYGGSIAFGSRTYFSKTKRSYGFYSGNYLKYSSIEYDEPYYKGRYSYFTFFAPEIGWKPAFGSSKRFFADINIGAEWVIEIAGGGDVDNKSFDNWKIRAGLGVGYIF